MKRIIIGITGATGTIYGWRLMEMLRSEGDIEIHLVMSPSAKLTLKMEHDVDPDRLNALADDVHAPGNIGAAISSGSFFSEGMIIAPCSIKTMSNIAMGNTGDLITRAADVILKERRKLVVAVREELFRQVWERPMTKVAADYGISAVALKKICDKHRIRTNRFLAQGRWPAPSLRASRGLTTRLRLDQFLSVATRARPTSVCPCIVFAGTV